jgi:predicted phosphodiesterase
MQKCEPKQPPKTKSHGPTIPTPIEEGAAAFTIDTPGVWGVISDIHLPFHVTNVLELFAEECKRRNVAGIICNGDVLDFYKVSSHLKDPSAMAFRREVDVGQEFWVWLRANFRKARIIHKEGNHEERLSHYVWSKAPELDGIQELTVPGLMKHDATGIEYVSDRRIIQLGKLPIVHGHEFQRGFAPPVNAARGLFLKAKMSAIAGHHHQSASNSERRLDGKIIKTWGLGCACNLRPRYCPMNNWTHGFAFTELFKDGTYRVDNLTVIDGKLY